MLIEPVTNKPPSSIEVTRVAGMKIRRRCGISTMKPSIRGFVLDPGLAATASRIFPTRSPFGSKTGVPASLARNINLICSFSMRHLQSKAMGKAI